MVRASRFPGTAGPRRSRGRHTGSRTVESCPPECPGRGECAGTERTRTSKLLRRTRWIVRPRKLHLTLQVCLDRAIWPDQPDRSLRVSARCITLAHGWIRKQKARFQNSKASFDEQGIPIQRDLIIRVGSDLVKISFRQRTTGPVGPGRARSRHTRGPASQGHSFLSLQCGSAARAGWSS